MRPKGSSAWWAGTPLTERLARQEEVVAFARQEYEDKEADRTGGTAPAQRIRGRRSGGDLKPRTHAGRPGHRDAEAVDGRPLRRRSSSPRT